MNSDSSQERKWIDAARQNPEAFRYLFEKYFNRMYNYVLRRTMNEHVARDLTSNVFMKALDNIHTYRHQGHPFSAWLYRIATNEVLQYFRSRKKWIPLNENHAMTLQGSDTSDGAMLKNEDAEEKLKQQRDVHAAISNLKLKYQNVISLRYFENLSIREIAEVLDLPENTVKTRIRRGLQKLKELL